jgi:serine/threonine-protein kinase
MEVMVAHARDPVTPPSELQRNVPADLEAVVLRCLAKNPKDRSPDATSLARALEGCADAPNWSPEQAAAWWHANLTWKPGEDFVQPASGQLATTAECPVPTEELDPAEFPGFR